MLILALTHCKIIFWISFFHYQKHVWYAIVEVLRKWDVLYRPVFPLFHHIKQYFKFYWPGCSYFWICNVSLGIDTPQHLLCQCLCRWAVSSQLDNEGPGCFANVQKTMAGQQRKAQNDRPDAIGNGDFLNICPSLLCSCGFLYNWVHIMVFASLHHMSDNFVLNFFSYQQGPAHDDTRFCYSNFTYRRTWAWLIFS